MSSALDPAALACTLIADFLSPAECVALIARLESAGIGGTAALYPPSYRNNDRLVIDDAQLAATLYERIAAYAPAEIVDGIGDDTGDGEDARVIWRRQRLNPRFRCCRYRDGQCFTIHRDGEYHAGPRERSHLTFMIYLNDGDEFSGGATRYYHDRSGRRILRQVTPRRGACILFDHRLWHDGEAVHRGTKYVLRSDVIYRANHEIPPAQDPPVRHLGYIWSAIRLGHGGLASAGRDQTIRTFRSDDCGLHEEQVLRGHQSSIACLAEARGALWSGDRTGQFFRWQLEGQRYHFASAFAAHDGAVLSLLRVIDRDFGECIATSGADGAIRLFSDKATAVRELRGHTGWVWTLAARRETLYSGGEDRTVRRCDLQNPADAVQMALGAAVHALCCTDDRLLVGMSDGRLVMLDPRTLETLFERKAHDGAVRCLLALRNGTIASGGEDDWVVIWSADLRTALHRYRHNDFVRAIIELPSGALLSASYDGTLRTFTPSMA